MDIDLDAIRRNICNAKQGKNKTEKVCAVIKADGYGHGAVQIAKNISDIVDFFAVACIDEAMELVENGIRLPILILGYTHPSYFETAIQNEIRMTVYDEKAAGKIAKVARAVNKTAKIHIKLNTGMNRIGFRPSDENLEVVRRISRMKGIEVEGIFTHLHSADETDLTSAYEQIGSFRTFTEKLKEMGVEIPIRHCANSAAAIKLPQADFDMFRLGIAMYGLYPSPCVMEQKLYPAMSLYSHVTMVKMIKKGESVGYGARFTASKTTRVATVSVGYADGYLRNLTNKGYVLIRGKKAKILGSVCMDQIMVDVSRIPETKVDDTVVLVGKSGNQVISMEEIAGLGGTINYEFACGITRRVAARYFRKGKVVYIKESC